MLNELVHECQWIKENNTILKQIMPKIINTRTACCGILVYRLECSSKEEDEHVVRR